MSPSLEPGPAPSTDPWQRLDAARIGAAVRALLAGGWLDDERPAVLVHDLDLVQARARALAAAFPEGALHAVAIKASPVVAILRALVDAGMGLEAASWEEVELARAAGCAPDRIVFDSPAKTRTELLVLDPHGQPRHGPVQPWTIVGPLCFAGDVIARDRPLPAIAEGDLLVVRDTGGYTLGMWSRHCSRGIPEVLGLRGPEPSLHTLRPRETAQDVVRFWSP